MPYQAVLNWLALLLSVGLFMYGVSGFLSGKVKASSYAFMTESTYTGTKAKLLAVAWVIFGTIGIIAFGGHLLGIQAVAPLYDVATSFLNSD